MNLVEMATHHCILLWPTVTMIVSSCSSILGPMSTSETGACEGCAVCEGCVQSVRVVLCVRAVMGAVCEGCAVY